MVLAETPQMDCAEGCTVPFLFYFCLIKQEQIYKNAIASSITDLRFQVFAVVIIVIDLILKMVFGDLDKQDDHFYLFSL